MAGINTHCAPVRPARWLYGEGIGMQVWEIDAFPSAVLLIGQGGPILALSRRIARTLCEGEAVAWAFDLIARCSPPGVYIWLT